MSQSQIPTKHDKHKHPHADAQYRVYPLDDGTFGIEVTLPEALPTKVTSFSTRAAANQWIEDHKKTIEKQRTLGSQPQFGRRLGRKQTDRG